MSGYFDTMHIPIVEGRDFESADAALGRSVVIINETLANTVWKGRSPLGQRVRPQAYPISNSWHTVIGVAKDVKQYGVDKNAGSDLYVLAEAERSAPSTMNVIIRTTLPPAALTKTVEQLVKEVDPAVPVVRLRDMESVFTESIRRPRLVTALLGAFAALALLLASIGTYGVLSYMVAERRREIGIRIALGARRANVFVLVMKQGLELTVMGLAIGIAGSLGLSGVIDSLLFGVQPTDRATFAIVTATITSVAMLACAVPAWRASRVDPGIMLKHE